MQLLLKNADITPIVLILIGHQSILRFRWLCVIHQMWRRQQQQQHQQ